MPRSLRIISVFAALMLALGTVPALADEAGDSGADDTTDTTEEPSFTDNKLMILLAEGTGATEEQVAALADLGLGFGAIFKLSAYATALGVPTDDLLTAATFDEETGEWDFGFGDLRASLSDDQLATLEDLPKNLGAVVSNAVRHQGRDANQPDHARADDDKPGKGSKPDHAERGGRSDK